MYYTFMYVYAYTCFGVIKHYYYFWPFHLISVCVCVCQVSAVVASLEDNLQLLCITGVEDQLQIDVRPTLELLRNAGIRVCVWSVDIWVHVGV